MSWLATALPDIIAAVASGSTVLAWYEARRSRRGTDLSKQQAKEDSDLAARIDARITARVTLVEEHLREVQVTTAPDAIRAMVRAEIAPLAAAVTRLEAKMDVIWTAIAANIAKVLHQPDPRRRHIDDLLEKLTDGSLKADERERLRGYLKVISDWEPGVPSDFPVHPGEQVAAAILLSIMDHALDKGGSRHG